MMNKLGIGDSDDGLSHQFEHEIAELIQCRAVLEEMDRMQELGVSDEEKLAESRKTFKQRREKAQSNLEEIIADSSFQTRLEGRLEARLKAIQQDALSKAERSGLLSTHVGEDIRWKLDTELTLLLDKEELKGEVPLPKA